MISASDRASWLALATQKKGAAPKGKANKNAKKKSKEIGACRVAVLVSAMAGLSLLAVAALVCSPKVIPS